MKKFLAALTVLSVLALCACAFADEPKLKTIDDLKNQRLAAQRGTTGQYIAEDLLGDNKSLLFTTYEK